MKDRWKRVILYTIFLCCFLLAAYISSDSAFTKHLQENTEQRVSEIARVNVTSFNFIMSEQMKNVNTVAGIMSDANKVDIEEQRTFLQSVVKSNNLYRSILVLSDGSTIASDGIDIGNVAQREFFQANSRGEFFISEPQRCLVAPDKRVIMFSAPVMKGNKVIGALGYVYLCDDISKVLDIGFLEDQGKMMVMKKDGKQLIGKNGFFPEGTNIIKYIRDNCTHAQHSQQSCFAVDGTNGEYVVTLKDIATPLIINYELLDFNNWYMLSIVPENAAMKTVNEIMQSQKNHSIFIVVCVAIYVLILIAAWLHEQNRTDKLTGALTVQGFKHCTKQLLKDCRAQQYVFVKLDVKNFKLINRIYSFEVGDNVIKNVAEALKETLMGVASAFCRTSVDEFVILLPFYNHEELNEYRKVFIKNFRKLMGEDFKTVVEFPTGQYVITEKDCENLDISEIMEKLNFAHRAAKQRPYSNIVDYAEDIEKEALLEKSIGDKIETALAEKQFALYLQPKFSAMGEQLYGAEALVRWKKDGKILMNPAEFIPVLEKNGFIVKVDMYMFERAVEQIRKYLDAGYEPIPISVNFSRLHLRNVGFVQELCDIADRHNVPRKYLEVEITETAIFDNTKYMMKLIDDLHEAGFTISMDDFGTGYSSLTLIKELKVDVLKLDRGFFVGGVDPQRSQIVISNILRMAKELHVKTVAEGVEVFEHVELLRNLGCDAIQGFYFSRPIPAEELDLSKYYFATDKR